MFYKLFQDVLFRTGPSFKSAQSNEMFHQMYEAMLFLKGPSSKNRKSNKMFQQLDDNIMLLKGPVSFDFHPLSKQIFFKIISILLLRPCHLWNFI